MKKTKNGAVATRLKELRTSLRMTQRALAEKLEITAAAYSAYETANILAPLSFLMKIHEEYGVSLDWLCGFSGNKNGPSPESVSDAIHMVSAFVDKGYLRLEAVHPHNGPEYAYLEAVGSSIKNFLLEWERMYQLMINKTIDRGLYELWLEKQSGRVQEEYDKEKELPF